ncbi:hypothetical protein [Aureivirga sp. CE67]|uniref:hypothetical protein n=1 Tax=Aureivirga sp. CE67 TaxID=1788983 RepID=UPI001E36E2D5|nr:hypothetical protein [Aureivirga sp. CE67]
MKLESNNYLTKLVKNLNLNNWDELTSYIRKLPYGRNKNRFDFSLVLKEKKGSCSSKHAVLKKIAQENNLDEIKQILGIYKMNNINTPGIGEIKINSKINYIPEAHCYLEINGEKFDFTSEHSNYSKIENDILKEIEIQPEDVIENKINLHKKYIQNWIKEFEIQENFEEICNKRENCIKKLTEKKSLYDKK